MINNKYTIPIVLFLILVFMISSGPSWGFFGHRKINRIAVFSLPPEMIVFYKHHIEFITEHAVDPDKRRYATENEGVRHYIDIDHWGPDPFNTVPKKIIDAILKYASYTLIDSNNIKTDLEFEMDEDSVSFTGKDGIHLTLDRKEFKNSCNNKINRDIYLGEWIFNLNEINKNSPNMELAIRDHFVEYGIVPYHLQTMQARLERAFYTMDAKSILRTSAEIGHYIADASVPLHTTENYNGQMTNQIGIHAFWESRLPELFADSEYDLYVGKPTYISDKSDYFWQIVKESHELLSKVLSIEKSLSETFPSDKQFCFDDRLGNTIKTQCESYARSYRNEMDHMVESRMYRAIKSISDIWYTSWVDAGSPDLSKLINIHFTKEEMEAFKEIGINKSGVKFKVRAHEH